MAYDPAGSALISDIENYEREDFRTIRNGLGNSLTKMGQVLPLGSGAAWDTILIEGFNPIYAPDEGRFAGVYTGYSTQGGNEQGAACLAWSDDMKNWTKVATPLLTASGGTTLPDSHGLTGPVLLYDAGTYYLYYIGLSAYGYEGGTPTVCVASSPSLTTPVWTRHGAILSPNSGVAWRHTFVWHPTILKRGTTWYCFMNATNSSNQEVIGYATSPSLLGPWTFDDVNSPLITPSSGNRIAGDPSVTKFPGGFRMDYYQATTDSSSASDYYAVTTDSNFPLGWVTKNGGSPILSPGATGSIDEQYAHKPGCMIFGGRMYHFYTAVGSNGRVAALAVDPPFTASLIGAPVVTGIASTDAIVTSLLASLSALGLPVIIIGQGVTDNFTRADGAMGTTDSGATWVAGGGTGWNVVSDQAKWTGGSDGSIAVNSGNFDNYTIQFTVVSQTGGFPVAFLARGSSATSYIKIYRDNANGRWTLVDTAVGAETHLATSGIANGDVLKLNVHSNVFTLYQNGTQIAQTTYATSHTNATTDIWQGIIGSGGNQLIIDAFTVTSP